MAKNNNEGCIHKTKFSNFQLIPKLLHPLPPAQCSTEATMNFTTLIETFKQKEQSHLRIFSFPFFPITNMSLSPSILLSVLEGKMTLLFEIINLAVFLIQLGFFSSPMNSINYSITFPYFPSLRIPFSFSDRGYSLLECRKGSKRKLFSNFTVA